MTLSLPLTDPVQVFALTMALLMLAPIVARRLHLPDIVGYILAGAVAGPSVLGLLVRAGTFDLLGTVGLLYLMFMAGVSLDLAQFSKLRSRSIAFGSASFFIPQVMALGVGIYFLGMSVPTALLLGSIVGSHTLLAYPIAERLGITKSKSVIMAIGATIITDLLSLLILAVVIASVGGDAGLGFWLRFVIFVGVWAAAVLILLPRFGRWFLRTVRLGGVVDFAFLLSMVFLTAWLAEVVGLAPIIGAFLAGLTMNQLVPRQSPLMTRITFVGNALFIPFFLISVGMLIDVGVLVSSLAVWGLALAFTTLVVVGKTAAALLARFVYKYSPEEGWAVAGLTIPQAAATLAVTLVGFDVGLFSETAVNAVVVMILLTSLLGPSLVERFGRAVALQEEQRPYSPSEAPQRIMVTLSNPESAEALVDLALLLHSPQSEQPIYPLSIVRDGPNDPSAVAAAEDLLEQAVVHAASADVPCTPLTRLDVDVAGAIARAAREQRISTIVIGWNGQSETHQRIFGTVLDQLLEQTRETVVVARAPHPMTAPQRMRVALPPLIEREPGFPATVRALKVFAAQRKMAITLYVPREAAETVGRLFARTRPEADVRIEPLDAWNQLVPTLDPTVTPDDVLVLLSVRRGSIAWRPSVDRLPRVLARRFPETDLLTVYLSEIDVAPTPAETSGLSESAALAAMLPSERVTLHLPEAEPAALLDRLLATTLPDDPDRRAELARALLLREADYAPELTPGAALFHARTDAVTEPLLALGVSEVGFRLPHASEPVHIILVHAAPTDVDREAYVQRLAAVAQLVRDERDVEAVRAAQTPDEARRMLFNLSHETVVA